MGKWRSAFVVLEAAKKEEKIGGVMLQNKNKMIGIVSLVYGILATIYGIISLFVIWLQKEMFKTSAFSASAINMKQYIEALHSILLIYMPFFVLIGILFIISSISLLNNKYNKNLTFVPSILSISWFIVYAIHSTNSVAPLANIPVIFVSLGYIFSGIIICGCPIFILIYITANKNK